jgi:hypothetical protein
MSTPSIPVELTGDDQAVLPAGPAEYKGFSIRETNGAVAVIQIFDNGGEASGTLLDTISLDPDESAREDYHNGIRAQNGVFVHVVSGSFEGSLRIG